MMISGHVNSFRITDPFSGESIGHIWIPHKRKVMRGLDVVRYYLPKETFEQTEESPVIYNYAHVTLL